MLRDNRRYLRICQDSESWDLWNPASPGLVRWSGTLRGRPCSRASYAGHSSKASHPKWRSAKGSRSLLCARQPAHHQAPPAAGDTATSLGVPRALGFLSVPQCRCQIKSLTHTLLLSYGNKLLRWGLCPFRWQMYILMGDFANNVFKRGSKGEIYVHMWQTGMGEGGRANSLADNTKGCVREREAATVQPRLNVTR